MAQLGYNPAEVPKDEREEFSLMPAGDYVFLVNGSEVKDGKKAGAKRLIFTVTVQGPTHKGQKLWPDFNFQNPSPEAQRIGRQQLNKFAEACGVQAASLRDSSQLHNKVFTGSVVVIPAEGQYKAKNEIKSFAPAGGQQAGYQRPAQPAQQQPPADPPADHPAWAEGLAQGSAQPPAAAQASAPAAPPWMTRQA